MTPPPSDAAEILKLIENVDPNSSSQMFRLNEAVYEWLLRINPKSLYGQFVSSRDALKAVRPEGWFHKSDWYSRDCFSSWMLKSGDTESECGGEILPTEELAELHATIQCIAYKRTQQ